MKNTAEIFLDALISDLKQKSDANNTLTEFIARLIEIDCKSFISGSGSHEHPTVKQYLNPALNSLDCSIQLADAVKSLSEKLNWYQLYDETSIDPILARGMVAGQFVGKNGLVESDKIFAGLFLIAAGVHYSLHQHEALEIYSVVSGTLTLQHGIKGIPFDVDADSISLTPSHLVHSLTVTKEPCLIIYVWTGALKAPIWLWEQDELDQWQRICWERQHDASWKKNKTEPVTDTILSEAGEI